jgi:hypothetical protein
MNYGNDHNFKCDATAVLLTGKDIVFCEDIVSVMSFHLNFEKR